RYRGRAKERAKQAHSVTHFCYALCVDSRQSAYMPDDDRSGYVAAVETSSRILHIGEVQVTCTSYLHPTFTLAQLLTTDRKRTCYPRKCQCRRQCQGFLRDCGLSTIPPVRSFSNPVPHLEPHRLQRGKQRI